VPAGGLSPDGQTWVSPRNQKFFLPVTPLGRLFRGKFLAYLKEAFAENRLEFFGQLRELAHPARFSDFMSSLYVPDWVVYCKPAFGGPRQVLQYLARYTHRVAISNGRLLGLDHGQVRFRWRDSQDHNQTKEMSLDAVEFIRRFLLHVLPSGFVKIRHFGFLSNRNRKRIIRHCRGLLPPFPAHAFVMEPHQLLCPVCKVGHLHVIDWGSRPAVVSAPYQPVPALDSS
jgi:Putative transposase